MPIKQLNPETGKWEPALPMAYPYTLLPWLWKRLTGWRDQYGRKAELYFPLIKKFS